MNKASLNLIGAYVADVIAKFVMSVVLLLFSAALIIVIKKVTAFVDDPLFTTVMWYTETCILIVDSSVLVWFVFLSALKLIVGKEA